VACAEQTIGYDFLDAGRINPTLRAFLAGVGARLCRPGPNTNDGKFDQSLRTTMKKGLFTRAIAIGAIFGVPGMVSPAWSQASVRLDVPPGYFGIPPPAPQRVGDCPTDCVNFDAGYAWAEEHRIKDLERCVGRARPFVTGCLTYVAELSTAHAENNRDMVHRKKRHHQQ
jgi:hypothetical protein